MDYRQAPRADPSVAAGWISNYINSGKWEGYTPHPCRAPSWGRLTRIMGSRYKCQNRGVKIKGPEPVL